MELHAGGPLDFTDGTMFKRVTITDATANIRSQILVGVQRHNVAETDDDGFIYVANVANKAAGSFEVNVAVLAMGEPEVNDEGPNEVVDLVYLIN